MSGLTVDVAALTDLEQYIGAFPDATREAARIALNDVTEQDGLARFRKAIEDQVDFGPGYLTTDRLGIVSKARNEDLKVVVVGRQRATSLARFAKGQTPESTKGQGVTVRVKPGRPQALRSAFLVRLRQGGGNNDGYNLGLAVRLKPGETIRNTTKAVQLDNNVYLLYGPSVDQIFRDVAIDETPAVLEEIGNEFFRQFFRLIG
jgi:hypothetical protein